MHLRELKVKGHSLIFPALWLPSPTKRFQDRVCACAVRVRPAISFLYGPRRALPPLQHTFRTAGLSMWQQGLPGEHKWREVGGGMARPTPHTQKKTLEG